MTKELSGVMDRRFIAIQSLVLIGSMLLSGCSQISDIAGSVLPGATTTTVTESIPETTPSPTPTPAVYDFKWELLEYEECQRVASARFNPISFKDYVMMYGGFDRDLQEVLTAYVNEKYSREYETVPFSAVNYMRTVLTAGLGDAYKLKNNYKRFSSLYLNSKGTVATSSFKNKLVFSYLIQNDIALGDRIPLDNLMDIRENVDISKYNVKPYLNNKTKKLTGNFKNTYEYSAEDLLTVMTYYNRSVSSILLDYRIMPLDFNTNEENYSEDLKELKDICNGYLKKHYGDKAPQIGEKITKEQYVAIFGEEPLDLSYIPGGVHDTAKKYQSKPFTADTGNSEAKEKLVGKWIFKNNTISYTFELKDDSTGTLTTVRKFQNYNTRKKKIQTRTTTIDFKYAVKFGSMIEVEFSTGVKENFFFQNDTVTRLYLFKYGDIIEIKALDFKKSAK